MARPWYPTPADRTTPDGHTSDTRHPAGTPAGGACAPGVAPARSAASTGRDAGPRSGQARQAAAAERSDADAALGTPQVSAHPQVTGLQLTRTGSRLIAREQLQGTLRRITRVGRLERCGCHVVPGTGAVGVRWSPPTKSASASAGFSSVERCGSVWACPTCSARIAATRAEEISGAVTRWLDMDASHGALLLTATVRHRRGQGLRMLWDAVQGGWRGVTQGAAWRGSKKTDGDLRRYAIEGWVRAVEVTHGASGWHVHVHALVLTRRALSPVERQALGDRIFGRWSRAVQRKGLSAPTRSHGVDVRPVSRAGAAEAGAYLGKGAGGVGGVGAEVGAGSLKSGRRQSRTPMEVLRDAGAGDAGAVALWHEWEAGSRGRRQVGWSQGLRELLAVEEISDQEAAEQEIDGTTVGLMRVAAWRRIARDAHARGLILAAVASAQTLTAAVRACRSACELVGVEWCAPPTPLVDPSAAVWDSDSPPPF